MSQDEGERRLGLLPGLYRALIVPDESFRRDIQYTVSRVWLFLLIVALVLCGSVLRQEFYRNETARALTVGEVTRRVDKMMANAPKEQREAALRRALATASREGLSLVSVVGLVLGAARWPVFVVEVWFLGIILMQFLGGEELPVGSKKHRRSLCLALFCTVPLAFAAMIRGVVLYFKGPTAIGGVLTLAEYTAAAEVSFSLVALLGLDGLSGFVRYLAYNLTDPFCLWSIVIGVYGGRSVFAVGFGKMVLVVSLIFIVVGLQGQMFARISGLFGG